MVRRPDDCQSGEHSAKVYPPPRRVLVSLVSWSNLAGAVDLHGTVCRGLSSLLESTGESCWRVQSCWNCRPWWTTTLKSFGKSSTERSTPCPGQRPGFSSFLYYLSFSLSGRLGLFSPNTFHHKIRPRLPSKGF